MFSVVKPEGLSPAISCKFRGQWRRDFSPCRYGRRSVTVEISAERLTSWGYVRGKVKALGGWSQTAASSEWPRRPVISACARPGRLEVVNDRWDVTDCCLASGPPVCHRGPPGHRATSARPARPAGPGAFIAARRWWLDADVWRASKNMATTKKLAPVTRPNFRRVHPATSAGESRTVERGQAD